jgi:hypothetical protein
MPKFWKVFEGRKLPAAKIFLDEEEEGERRLGGEEKI